MRSEPLLSASEAREAPAWRTTRWFNADDDFGLHALRGRVVALHTFQMLCPGCVLHGIPQAQRIQATFDPETVAVVGLHTVFEHHEAMGPVALEAFLHEYRVSFPVGVDAPSADGPVPQTMARYLLRGTPSLVLIDHLGRLRYRAFGRPDDMSVGAAIAALVGEQEGLVWTSRGDEANAAAGNHACSSEGCAVSGEESGTSETPPSL
jgi:hypothetical protein